MTILGFRDTEQKDRGREKKGEGGSRVHSFAWLGLAWRYCGEYTLWSEDISIDLCLLRMLLKGDFRAVTSDLCMCCSGWCVGPWGTTTKKAKVGKVRKGDTWERWTKGKTHPSFSSLTR